MGRGERAETLVDGWTASPGGALDSADRLLALSSRELPPGLSGAWAVIEGPPEAVRALRQTLRARLSSDHSSAHNADPAQSGPALLARATQDVASCANGLSAALVLRTENRLHLSFLGDAHAFLDANDDLTEVPVTARADEIREASIEARTEQTVVVLVNSQPANLSFPEIRQAVRESLSSEALVEWLASLAAARSGDSASVLLLSCQARPGLPTLPRAGLPISWAGGAIAAVVAILAIAFLLHAVLLGQSRRAEPAITGLRAASVGPTHADLAWNGIPRARAYIVHIAGATYRSAAPHVHVTRGLRPGANYPWRVRAEIPSDPPVLSRVATLHLPELYPAPAIEAVRPHGVRSLFSAAHVQFCWRTDTSAQSFDLYVVGPSFHFHRTYERSELRVGRRGALCAVKAIDPSASYAWRAGATAPEHRESWTGWTDFWFGQTPHRTSTVAVESVARSIAAAVPVLPAIAGAPAPATG